MKRISKKEYEECYEHNPESVVRICINANTSDYQYVLIEQNDSNVSGKIIKKFLETELISAIEIATVDWTKPNTSKK